MATQYPQSDDKDWHIVDQANKELTRLPSDLDERGVMSYLHFARPFELEALNIGINHGRIEAEKNFANKEIAYKSQIEFLEQQNQRLSTQLERHILGQEEENI